MITSIPKDQRCQAFDPKMNLPPSVLKVQNAKENANTSCTAHAFVYIEGSHGKKFLCDYHYYYEVYMTKSGYLPPDNPWQNIQEFILDETERVKETFAKNVHLPLPIIGYKAVGKRREAKLSLCAVFLPFP